MKIIETSSRWYLCSSLTVVDNKTRLVGAHSFDEKPAKLIVLAKEYIKGQLKGTLRTITLNTANIETESDAPEELVSAIELLKAMLSRAERNAKANATMRELKKLIDPDCRDDDDDDDDDDF